MSTDTKAITIRSREEWLASLKVGDKVVWRQLGGTIRAVLTIERVTPTCWVLSNDMYMSKVLGRTQGLMSGIMMEPHWHGAEAARARQERQLERYAEHRDLVNKISKFSAKRLREIVATYSRKASS